MATAHSPLDDDGTVAPDERSRREARLLFYVGVPLLTALLFALNKTGMARVLPGSYALPYWIGLTLPLWLLLDGCTRAVHLLSRRFEPHRWLVLLAGALAAMALFSPYVMAYTDLFRAYAAPGTDYSVAIPFPEAFLDLRRFVAFSGVPIYWMVVAFFFARYFNYPLYLVPRAASAPPPPPRALPAEPAAAAPETARLNDFGLPVRTGFRALLPFHLGGELVSLSAEDHYVRVVTDKGNALIRYRFADALTEVRDLPGIRVHRSHWVSVRAIERVRTNGKSYHLILSDGTDVPVSRTNIGLLRNAGLV